MLPAPGYGEAPTVWTFSYNSDYLLSLIDAPNGSETDLLYNDYRLCKVVNGVGATDPNTGASIETTWKLQSGLADLLDNSGNHSPTLSAGTACDLHAKYTTYSGYDTSYGQGGGSASTTCYGTDAYGYVTSLTEPATTTAWGALTKATWTWTRDGNGLPTYYYQPPGGGGHGGPLGQLTTSYQYDSQGNPTDPELSDGTIQTWFYNDANGYAQLFSTPSSSNVTGTGVDQSTTYAGSIPAAR